MHIHPHPLDWLHFESSLETVRGKLDSGDNLPLIPAASLGNTLRMEFEKNLNWLHSSYVYVDVNTVFSQNKVNAYETETGGYTLLNVGFGGLLRITGQDIELRLSTNNLFDKAYISHLSRLKPDGIVNIGRNISLALTVRI
jgi:iron complex outermembrane receptor protein